MLSDQKLDLHAKTDYVYDHLVEAYGERQLKPCPDNLRELIFTILSHRTNKYDERRAFDQMWERFGSWEGIQNAPQDELIETLSPSRFPERKAPYIQAVLRRIKEERGEYNIDFLAEIPTDEAMQWLLSMPGVGVKTASLVMLFCFHRDVMPVDTHLHRVSGRLGLIRAKISAESAHVVLRDLVGEKPHRLYNFHVSMLKHGQQICTFNNPRCGKCVVNSVCDYYREIKGGS
ncbi:MAG: endonuclease III [bacterium]|nr:endonuclease III [bacterium]